ncbi:MAG: hypothetical protein AAB214_03620 [Fibrobacterota bacterium]
MSNIASTVSSKPLLSFLNLECDEFLPVVSLDLEHFKSPTVTKRNDKNYNMTIAQSLLPDRYPKVARQFQRPRSTRNVLKNREVQFDSQIPIGARGGQIPLVITDPGRFRYRFLVESSGSSLDKDGILVAKLSPNSQDLAVRITSETRVLTKFGEILELELQIDGVHPRDFRIDFFASDDQDDFNVGEHTDVHCGSLDFRVRQVTKVGLELVQLLSALDKAPPGYDIGFNHESETKADVEKSQTEALRYVDCGGICYATARARANEAFRRILGKPVLDLTFSNKNLDHAISSAQNGSHPLSIYGVGGAVARNGYGVTLSEDQCWAGLLQPGALLQIWYDFKNLESPHKAKRYHKYAFGHSYIFIEYIFDDIGDVIGIVYIDNHGSHYLYKPKDFAENLLFGTNLLDTHK